MLLKKRKGIDKSIRYASWNKWDAKSYLEMYFSKLGPDSIIPVEFFSSALSKKINKKVSRILDFGCGPTIFGASIIDNFCKEIHVADYLESNLGEIQSWQNDETGSFNWKDALSEIDKIKVKYGIKIPRDHAKGLKRKIKKLFRCDASLANPLGETDKKYPMVITMYCPDSATSSKEIWKVYMKNICSLVEKNGYLLISSLRKCKSYKNGGASFPSANIDEKDLQEILNESGFVCEKIKVFKVPECKKDGFTSIVCALAKKWN